MRKAQLYSSSLCKRVPAVWQMHHALIALRSGVQCAGAAAASGRKLLGKSRIFTCQNSVIVGGPPTHSNISLIPATALLMPARL